MHWGAGEPARASGSTWGAPRRPDRPSIDPAGPPGQLDRAKVDPGGPTGRPKRPESTDLGRKFADSGRFSADFSRFSVDFGAEMAAETVSATRAAQLACRWRFRCGFRAISRDFLLNCVWPNIAGTLCFTESNAMSPCSPLAASSKLFAQRALES